MICCNAENGSLSRLRAWFCSIWTNLLDLRDLVVHLLQCMRGRQNALLQAMDLLNPLVPIQW